VSEHGDGHSRGPPGPRRRRSGTPGCLSWTRNHPPPESVFPRARTEGLCLGAASLHSGHLRGIGPEPGTWKDPDPGDGAAGDQKAQNRACLPGNGGTRRLRAVPSQRTSWRYGLRRTCRLVTGRSHRPRSTWPNQARLAPLAVTHRHNRIHCLWLEQFQIADYFSCLAGLPCDSDARRSSITPLFIIKLATAGARHASSSLIPDADRPA
jgi:hypothetical protein